MQLGKNIKYAACLFGTTVCKVHLLFMYKNSMSKPTLIFFIKGGLKVKLLRGEGNYFDRQQNIQTWKQGIK